jgi:hypothetical protein
MLAVPVLWLCRLPLLAWLLVERCWVLVLRNREIQAASVFLLATQIVQVGSHVLLVLAMTRQFA